MRCGLIAEECFQRAIDFCLRRRPQVAVAFQRLKLALLAFEAAAGRSADPARSRRAGRERQHRTVVDRRLARQRLKRIVAALPSADLLRQRQHVDAMGGEGATGRKFRTAGRGCVAAPKTHVEVAMLAAHEARDARAAFLRDGEGKDAERAALSVEARDDARLIAFGDADMTLPRRQQAEALERGRELVFERTSRRVRRRRGRGTPRRARYPRASRRRAKGRRRGRQHSSRRAPKHPWDRGPENGIRLGPLQRNLNKA